MDKQPKIMTRPLPTILDELESYIQRIEEMVAQAQATATQAGIHAEEAKIAGERAIEDFRNMRVEHDKLKREVLQLVTAVNKAWVKGNETYLESAPYLSG